MAAVGEDNASVGVVVSTLFTKYWWGHRGGLGRRAVGALVGHVRGGIKGLGRQQGGCALRERHSPRRCEYSPRSTSNVGRWSGCRPSSQTDSEVRGAGGGKGVLTARDKGDIFGAREWEVLGGMGGIRETGDVCAGGPRPLRSVKANVVTADNILLRCLCLQIIQLFGRM